ncbi:MAG: DEAD/DEAH box helicase [Cyanobacteria bacterium REEB67]|nr:DEAD/DEAH box helicase [Cyanobacteria bacterium REEB67]
MTCEIAVTPDGRLLLTNHLSQLEIDADVWIKKIVRAFSVDQYHGLFSLGASHPSALISPSLAFWRDFACLYLTLLCQTPTTSPSGTKEPLPPAEGDLAVLLERLPPMRGAEYLDLGKMQDFWFALDRWLADQISKSGASLSDWLKQHAPLWNQVGRVCFHLAENKRDPKYPFAFLATYAPSINSGGRVQYQPLSHALQEYAGERNKKALINLLSPVQRASEKSSFIRALVESNEIFQPQIWTAEEAYRLLKDASIIEQSGLLVRLPDWWRKRARPRVTVTIGDKKRNSLGLDSMLDFRVDLVLGDMKLSRAELQALMNASADGLVFIKGQWVEVDKERLAEALAHWKKIEKDASDSGMTFIEGMRLLAGASADLGKESAQNYLDDSWSDVVAGDWLANVLSNLKQPGSKKDGPVLSKHFRGTLRPYQKRGHDWLFYLTRLGLGACLADDMGLGKTVQILALLLSLKEAKDKSSLPSLLVLPASLLANWGAELKRFAPTLKVCFIHPSQLDTQSTAALEKTPEKIVAGADVVLTTYSMLLRQPWLETLQWQLVILDEAQAIKNPAAQQTRAAKKLKSGARIVLTGTPVENRLSDLWSLFDFLLPGLLGSTAKFKAFIKNLDEGENKSYAPLRNLVSPYILRRLKTDKSIINDLPDKTEVSVFCGLAKKQAALYAKSVEELKESLKTSDGIKRRGLVLSFLMRFKQICNHPSQFLGNGAYDPLDSGKFERLRAICEEVASRQEKVLVFTQFREMTEPIAAFMAEIFGCNGLILHGGTAVGKRQTMVDTFQKSDGPPFMVLTVKAGGTGLNLTAASHVVHFDRWWNPAVENQATDRAFRIGQHRNVLVHKFICLGTIEEKIDLLIAEKKDLADDILSGGAEALLTEMSDKQLLEIVSLDLEKVSIGEMQ